MALHEYLSDHYTHLIERALLAVKVGKACTADSMTATQRDGTSLRHVELMAADWTRQIFIPLRCLYRHSGKKPYRNKTLILVIDRETSKLK